MSSEKESKTLTLQAKDNETDDLLHVEKCYFCNKEKSDDIELFESELYRRGQDEPSNYFICSEKHDLRVKRFYKFADNFYILFLIFVLLVPFILFVLIFLYKSLVFLFGIFMSIGLGLVILPLVGNQIIQNAGLKISNLTGRLLGATLIAIGLILLFTNGLKFIVN